MSPGLLALFPSSIAAFIHPPVSRLWLHASLLRAVVVAFFNTVAAAGWLLAAIVCANLYVFDPPSRNTILHHAGLIVREGHWAAIVPTMGSILIQAGRIWAHAAIFEKIATCAGVAAFIAAAYLVPYFAILPFAPRPGSNRACIRHVARTILLGSGLVHWWGIGFCAVMLAVGRSFQIDYEQAISPVLFLVTVLILWHLAVLIHAARRDYRLPQDQPKSHDPWCDVCGYNLIAADPAGRCPECGRPVAESLGPETRPPTPWERGPSLWNLSVIARQLGTLIRHPRRLFFSMPTLNGQRAAQRWLLWSMLAVAIPGALLVPILYIVLDAVWSPVAFFGALAMGLAWGLFGLMMVGIETAGIAAFSRVRGHPGGGIYLAASSKVTCYASTLMLLWVILGGIQLVANVYYSIPPHSLHNYFHLTFRWEQAITAGSLAIAHIGGLLWFELTVYRGVRSIQYANK